MAATEAQGPPAPSRSAQARPRIALAHDWLVGLRGGEWVLDRLAALFGPTDLYVLVDDGRPLTPAISACRVHTSPLQRLPFASGRLRRAYLPLMPWAVGRIRVAGCDLLVSTSSAVMTGIRPPPGVPHLCYCLSPARYLWEQTEDYGVGRGAWPRLAALRLVGPPLRRWDRAAAQSVTRFLACSRHTAARIRRCYGRSADVVYPPVRTEWFTPDRGVRRESFFLVVSALEPYKRVDLAIAAANAAGLRLVVAGDGSQRAALERAAGPTVTLLGRVPDEELRSLYRSARALVFPQAEDFGIVAVEAQACGCPVVAFARGGACETVTEETGLLVKEQTATAFAHAMAAAGRRRFDPAACRASAERFGVEAFDAALRAQVSELLGAGC